MSIEPILVYVTCADAGEAERIACAAVDGRLVACANIMAPHRSVYRWRGKVETALETVVIFKTGAHMFEKLEALIRTLHSYECPCIVALPIVRGHAPFLKWIETEIEGGPDRADIS